MNVELKFTSPAYTIPGLEQTLQRLEKMDALLTTIGRRHVTVNIDVKGNSLTTAIEQMDTLVSLMRVAGQPGMAEGLRRGLVTPGEAAQALTGKIKALNNEMRLLQQTVTSNQAKMDSIFSGGAGSPAQRQDFLTNLAKYQQTIATQWKGLEAMQAKISALNQAQGVASAMTGVEVKGGAAAQTAAVQAQTTAIQTQTAAVEKAVAVTKQRAAAEKQHAEALKQTASAEGALVRERRVMEGDKLVSHTRTFRDGDGRLRTVGNGLTSTDRNKLTEFRDMQARQAAGFAVQMTEATGPRGRIDVMRDQAKALMELHAQMKAAGLENTPVAQSFLKKAAGLEGQASQRDWRTTKDELRQAHEADKRLLKVQADIDKERAQEEADAQRAQEVSARQASQRAAAQSAAFAKQQAEAKRQAAEQAKIQAAAGKEASIMANNQLMMGDFARFAGQGDAKVGQPTEKFGADGSRTRTSRAMVENQVTGHNEVIRLTERWDAQGKQLASTLDRMNNSLDRTGRGVTSVGASFTRNLASVAMWTAAVSTLYAGLQALNAGFQSALNIDRQMATLVAVFRHGKQGALDLADASLRLAVANGRGADEAIDAATRWARLGMTQREAGEAVRVSLMAANVAEMTAADSAQALAAILTSYRLSAFDLSTVLSQLNSVSNTLNVTNKDLLEGIARTGAIAKQAGVPLAELIGLIGAGVSATGRPGAEFGNAIKSTIVALSNPELQGFLKERFDFDVFSPGGGMKDMSSILRELFVKTQGMNSAEKGELLQKIGGKNQASRLEAMLDNYVTAQERAIQAQRDLNSAEREGEKILDTTLSKVQSLGSAWALAWHRFYQGAPKGMVNGVLGAATGALGLVGDGAGLISSTVGDMVSGLNPFDNYSFTPGNSPGRGYMRTRMMEEGNAQVDAELGRMLKGWSGAAAQKQSAVMADRLLQTVLGNFDSMPESAFGSAGRAAGRDVAEQDELAARFLALKRGGKKDELRAELTAAAERMRADASGFDLAETNAATEAERYGRAALSRSQRDLATARGQTDRQAPERVAKLESRIADLTKLMEDARRERQTLPDFDEAYRPIGRGEVSFRDRLTAQKVGMGMLFDGTPMLGDREMDKLNRTFERVAAMRGMAGGILSSTTNLNLPGTNIRLTDQDRTAMRSEATNINLEADRTEREAKARREAARALDAMRDGREDVSRRMGAFGSGLTETERLFNTVRGAGTLDVLGKKGDERTGAAIELGNQLLRTREGILTRQFTIMRDIANERERENKEASRALMFASQQDQLTAALLARRMQMKGGFSAEQFQFLGQGTRQAVDTLMPSMLPPGMGKVGELEREKARLDGGMPKVLQEIEGLLQKLRGVSNVTAPQMGGVVLNFADQTNQIASALERVVVARLETEIREVNSRIDGFVAAVIGPGFAQAGGGDAIFGAS